MSMIRKFRSLGAVVALALTGATLTGCVYYPNRYAYGYGGGYYAPAPAVVVAPAPVVVGGYWGWGGGWHGRGWR
jgi:hypothetical protein